MKISAWLYNALRIILFPLWWPVWWLLRKANVVVSLFLAKEVGYLLVLMSIVLLCEALFAGDYWGKFFSLQTWSWNLITSCRGLKILVRFFSNSDIWSSAFISLFSVEKSAEHWFTMALFLVAWLIGGGGLVSVLVGQYNKDAAGGFRRWKFLVRNHVVVLGWDDGVLVKLANEFRESKRDCYVVTDQNVFELGKLLECAGIKNFCIYKGDYDNPKEWQENLQLDRAKKVFIMGERDEEAHDARVQILYEKVSMICKPQTEIKVNIHDFGLAQKLINKAGVYMNFHLRWAKWLWKKLIDAKQCDDYSLFVVGFGAMGKAIVLESTLNQGHVPMSILVTDDNSEKSGNNSKKPDKLESEKTRFLAQFPHMSKQVQFESNWQKGLEQIVKMNGEKAVIVVSKKRSEKGMLCMMEIVSKMGDLVSANTQLVLNQEVEGYVSGKEDEDVMCIGGNVKIQLFGMKKGC